MSRGQVPLDRGAHRIVVAAEGQKLWRKALREGDPISVVLEPARLSSAIAGAAGLKVRCTTKGELRVFVDGEDSGVTCPNEERISVTAGTHKISLFSPEKEEFVGEVVASVKGGNFSTRIHAPF